MALKEQVKEQLDNYCEETRDLVSTCVEMDRAPTALEFLRLVATNTPAVFRGGAFGWPALSKWASDEYLVKALGDKKVEISVTPDGYADAVVENTYFVEPGKRMMRMGSFLEGLAAQADISHEPTPASPILYLQSQNGNMGGEYAALAGDIPEDIPFATEALGHKPDAINFWMGNFRSVTSLHKDHYENVYGVVGGRKVFTLYPPSDYHCMHESQYQLASYDAESLEIIPSAGGEKIHWIPVDPDVPDHRRYPRFAKARPLVVTVDAGDLLYLPSLWYHHVKQGGERVVAVNWWYDMHYGGSYTAFQLVRGLSQAVVKEEEEDSLAE